MTTRKRKADKGTLKPLVRPPIQDAGLSRTEKLCVPVYHTHGLRQYMGTCKLHVDLDCRHLRHWKPGRGLGKTIMREWEKSLNIVPMFLRCKSCWPNAPDHREPLGDTVQPMVGNLNGGAK